MTEQNYDFRKRLAQVHRPGRRMPKQLGAAQEEITAAWRIAVPADSLLKDCAEDLRDYFAVSMDVELSFTNDAAEEKVIVYEIDPTLPKEGAYRIAAEPGRIRLIGQDARAAAQAGYLLEDLLNLEESPYFTPGVTDRTPIFRCRMIHSGWELDAFPDAHLNSIAHAGINAILIFVKGINLTPTHEMDFNDLIARAARYGLDVYAYSYMKSRIHPEDEGAEEFYDNLYGSLFRACPGFKGVVFVGESVEFPSHDPRTTGMLRLDNLNPDGTKKINKPNPGWFPCVDYPQWVNLVKRIIRREKPDADIVFWSYNWGKCAEEDRIALIDNLPTDISLQATFEMFENEERQGVPTRSVDYTASIPGPGKYFLSEAKAAARRGIPLYSMTNSGGLTWDVGVVPYEPAPYQWLKRYEAMRECHEKYGLCGSMDSHHFGFCPSIISELAKAMFTEEHPDGEAIIDRLIDRDWGAENRNAVREAYRLFSDALNDFIISNPDQYGPLRIGPAYPLVLFDDEDIVIPSRPGVHFGNNKICRPNYCYPNSTPEQKEKLLGEIRVYADSVRRFLRGAEILGELLPSLPDAKRDEARRIAGTAEFMGRAALTTHHVKRWYICKEAIRRGEDVPAQLAELRRIAQAESENVASAMKLAEFDSRLGFEPSMDYMCDPEHLRWKQSVMDRIVQEEIPALEKKFVSQ